MPCKAETKMAWLLTRLSYCSNLVMIFPRTSVIGGIIFWPKGILIKVMRTKAQTQNDLQVMNAKSQKVKLWWLKCFVQYNTLKHEAKMLQRDCTMLRVRVIEYFTKSLKVIENGTIQKLVYDFLFAFHSNSDSVLYRFWDKVRYWLKIAIFHIPAFDALLGSPHQNIAIPFGVANQNVVATSGEKSLMICLTNLTNIKHLATT